MTEDNKVVRIQQPSFGSLIPHFSKNPVKASQPTSITQSVALQTPTPVQVSQKFESTVRPIRSTPQGTIMSYGQTTREGLKGNYSMVGFQQSNMELRRVPFELQLPAPHAIDLKTLVDKLFYEYPGVTLNVNQIYKKEGEVYLPTNQISLIGTSLQYRNCSAIKEEFSTFVEDRKLSPVAKLELANPSQIEGDHTKNVVQREMLKLGQEEAGVVFLGKDEHGLMGKHRNYSMPDEIGYTPGTAGAMDFIQFIDEDNASVIKVVSDLQGGEAFYANGFDEKVISEGYKNASNLDREIVQQKIADSGVDQNLFLAVNVNSIFDIGMAEDFDKFIELVDRNKIDCKRACADLNAIADRASSRRTHAHSVGANLKEDTSAWRSFNLYEERVKGACERAYKYVSGMPGYSETYIDKEVKEKFLGNTSDKPGSLEEALLITKNLSNLKSLKNHPAPLFGSRLYTKNYKRK